MDGAYDIDVVMPMYNLIEISDIYSKISGNLWQYYRDEATLHGNDIDFPVDWNNSILLKFKEEITGQTGNYGTNYVQIMAPLKYLSHIWKTLEIQLINFEISAIWTN